MANVKAIKKVEFPHRIKQILVNGQDMGKVFSIKYTPGEEHIIIDLPIELYTEEYKNDETTNRC